MEDLSLDTLIRLGNKSLILHNDLINTCFIQICDLVLCFCYEMRSIEEISCESASLINKTSPTLSCLLEFQTIEEMLIKCYRRLLIYSLYRNCGLLQKA